MKITKYIPNTLTCLNLASGFAAIVLALDLNTLPLAPWFVFFAAVLDFSDGFAARLLKAYSEMGKQLDSLSDLVSFGVAPGVIIYKLLQISSFSNTVSFSGNLILILIAAMIPVFSALRLAKFNIDQRQTSSFIGLPTPASAILVASVTLIFFKTDNILIQYFIANKITLVTLVLVDSFLMVSELPMFSLKMKSLDWNDHKIQYIFLGLSVLMFILLKSVAVPFIIITYIFLSFLIYVFNRNKINL